MTASHLGSPTSLTVQNEAEHIAEAQGNVVLFADLLGFAALTEQYPIDALSLRTSDRLATMFGAVFKKNPLTHAFTEFHRSIRWTSARRCA